MFILSIYNSFFFYFSFILVYTIAYGVPEVKDPKERMKILLSTIGLIGVAVGLFAFIRSFGKNVSQGIFIHLCFMIYFLTPTTHFLLRLLLLCHPLYS